MKNYTLFGININVLTAEEISQRVFTKNEEKNYSTYRLGDFDIDISNNDIDGRNDHLKERFIEEYNNLTKEIDSLITGNIYLWGLARRGLVKEVIEQFKTVLKYEDENLSITYQDNLDYTVEINSRSYYEAHKELCHEHGDTCMRVKTVTHPNFPNLTYKYTYISETIKDEIKNEVAIKIDPKLKKIYELLGEINEISLEIINESQATPDSRIIYQVAGQITSLQNGYSWTMFEKANQYLESIGKNKITKVR